MDKMNVQRFPGRILQKRARRLIQLSGTPVEIVRTEVCDGHDAPRIFCHSHRHNARYTINEQERARRKRLLNPGGPLHSLLPAQHRCLQHWNESGTVRAFVSLSISLFSPYLSVPTYYSNADRSAHARNSFSPIEMCFHNRGHILK